MSLNHVNKYQTHFCGVTWNTVRLMSPEKIELTLKLGERSNIYTVRDGDFTIVEVDDEELAVIVAQITAHLERKRMASQNDKLRAEAQERGRAIVSKIRFTVGKYEGMSEADEPLDAATIETQVVAELAAMDTSRSTLKGALRARKFLPRRMEVAL